jgi:hypothetical protein
MNSHHAADSCCSHPETGAGIHDCPVAGIQDCPAVGIQDFPQHCILDLAVGSPRTDWSPVRSLEHMAEACRSPS